MKPLCLHPPWRWYRRLPLVTLSIPRRSTIIQGVVFAVVLGLAIISGTWQKETNTHFSDPFPVGIHMGANHASVGVLVSGNFSMVTDENGRSTIPSYVSFPYNSPPLVGFAALEEASSNPKNTIYNVRHIIGRDFSDPELERDTESLLYDVVNIDNKPAIKVQVNGADMLFSPEEISAMVFSHLKRTAEDNLGHVVHNVVITVPSHFHDAQREATKKAATMAGLNVLRTVNASVATAVGYEIDSWIGAHSSPPCNDCYFVVYDLEEAETQLTIENLYYGVFENFGTVTAKDFGGDDIENAVFNHAVSEFREKHNIKIPKNSQGGKRLKLEVERAQTKLQNENSADVEFLPGASSIPVSITITRAQIQDLNTKLSDRVLALLEQLLESHKIGRNEIDGVIFAGNPKHVAKIQPTVEAYLDGMKGIAYDDRIAPDIAATRGAASQAAYIHYEQYNLCTLGAYDILTDLSLGVETSGGVFTTVIPRNTFVPQRRSGVFSTATDNQDRVTIKVLEGERKKASGNRVLGTLELTDLPKKPRHELEVEIEFELDANNVLKVEARVQEVGKKVTQIFQERASLRYTQQQFDEIIEDVRENYQDDVLLFGERPLYNPDEINGLWVPDSETETW